MPGDPLLVAVKRNQPASAGAGIASRSAGGIVLIGHRVPLRLSPSRSSGMSTKANAVNAPDTSTSGPIRLSNT